MRKEWKMDFDAFQKAANRIKELEEEASKKTCPQCHHILEDRGYTDTSGSALSS